MTLAFTFTSFDIPSAIITQAAGINDRGQIIGTFQRNESDAPQGFLLSDGRITELSTLSGLPSTIPTGLNNLGDIVGTYNTGATLPDGFLYRSGRFQTVQAPGNQTVSPSAINDLGAIVGIEPNGDSSSFSLGPAFLDVGGRFSIIDQPDAASTIPTGINDFGQIIGNTTDSEGHDQGYLDTYGAITRLHYPRSADTLTAGLNNLDEIVGFYAIIFEPPAHSVALISGQVAPINYPGSPFTLVTGVNDFGQIVGYYETIDLKTDTFKIHGFTASPVAPR